MTLHMPPFSETVVVVDYFRHEVVALTESQLMIWHVLTRLQCIANMNIAVLRPFRQDSYSAETTVDAAPSSKHAQR